MLYSGCDFVGGESVCCVNGMLCQEMVKNMDKAIFLSGKARIETWYISDDFLQLCMNVILG